MRGDEPTMTQCLLTVQNISAKLADRDVLKSVDFSVADGEFFSLLGPSGCGKTTLLRIIAGFLAPSSGDLLWNGTLLTHLAPQKRDLNLVFQNYALFPHMSVFENVAFGLRMQKRPEAEIRQRTFDCLELVRMSAFAQRRISELSGGQQQRVALARAVAPRPKLVLLDEPLGALDLQLRKQMQLELKSLQRHLGMTFIYVTHDQEEAFAMSDRIALMNQGRLEQVASPEVLYGKPVSRFVAQFIGSANFLSALPVSTQIARCPYSQTEFNILRMDDVQASGSEPNGLGDVLVRPEQILIQTGQPAALPALSGRVEMRQYLGTQYRYHVKLDLPDPATILVDKPVHDGAPIDAHTPVHLQIISRDLPFYTRSSST